ncbi:hypothetical protein EPN96_12695 [bacterium]|nr:MAG: hypothetical protein EPN96_12695 [bacterium]
MKKDHAKAWSFSDASGCTDFTGLLTLCASGGLDGVRAAGFGVTLWGGLGAVVYMTVVVHPAASRQEKECTQKRDCGKKVSGSLHLLSLAFCRAFFLQPRFGMFVIAFGRASGR